MTVGKTAGHEESAKMAKDAFLPPLLAHTLFKPYPILPAAMETERHPLPPFLPENARLLMLGSFPPPKKRWSMEFYYPNWNNDMWRIVGLLFFNDRNHFADIPNKAFRKECIVRFLADKGIALYDTAAEVRRLQDNASDKFLEVVSPADLPALLHRLPQCSTIAATGQKAMGALCGQFQVSEPPTGGFTTCRFENRLLRLYRMPSSSRAYPLSIEKKAAVYHTLFQAVNLLS